MQTDPGKRETFDLQTALHSWVTEKPSGFARVAFVALLIASLFAATRAMGAAATSPPELVGSWQGTTEIPGPFKIGTYPSTVPEDHQSVMVEIAASGERRRKTR